MDDREVFLFNFFPVFLKAQFNFLAFCKDEDARSPLVDAVDDEEAVTRLRIPFADVTVEEVIGGLCFISRCCDAKQPSGLIYNDETLVFVENFQSFGQMFIS